MIPESKWNEVRNFLSDKIAAFRESTNNHVLAVGFQEGANAAFHAIREALEGKLRPGAK